MVLTPARAGASFVWRSRNSSAAWLVIECHGHVDETRAVLRQARELAPGRMTLIALAPEHVDLAATLLEAGADGCILEESEGDAVLERRAPPTQVPLSRAEQDVLHLLSVGYSYTAAAAALGVGVSAIEATVEALLRKLGL